MIKKLISFSDKEKEQIDQEAKEKELTFTEALRRIIDNYFQNKKNENK
ncbi:MAG: hypothetical protein GF334_02035 [Candidatus Altiarchaeales archaeon]|nr:hypothetical protein [Candidatus Altiarchaeales archaeon]